KARRGRGEPRRHAVDDLLHELEDVELTAVRVPFSGARRALALHAETTQGEVEVLEAAPQLRRIRELGQNRPSMSHDAPIGRRMRQQVHEMLRRNDRLVSVDAYLETERDELREEEVAGERRRFPRRGR